MITKKNVNHFYYRLHQLPNGSHYIPLSKYKGTSKKMWFLHTVCDRKIYIKPNMLLNNGTGCRYCGIKRRCRKRRLSDSTFKKRFSKLPYSNHYIQLTKCYGDDKPIKFIHTVCHHIISMTPHEIFNGNHCTRCRNLRMKKTMRNRRLKRLKHKKNRINHILYNDESLHNYVLIGKYCGLHSRTWFYHKICHHKLWMSPYELFNGVTCRYCNAVDHHMSFNCYSNGSKNRCLTDSEFKKRFNRCPWHCDYVQLTKCCGTCHKIKFLHKPCNHILWIAPSNILEKEYCKYCGHRLGGIKKRMSDKQFKCRFNKLPYHQNYVQLTKCYGSCRLIKFLHKPCNHIIYMQPQIILTGHHCPVCALRSHESMGEHITLNDLIRHGIIKNQTVYYGYQLHTYRMFGTRNDELHADFYLPNIRYNNYYNNGVVIEFDGDQHFKLIPYFTNTTDSYWQLMDFACENSRDILKDYYCMMNHIKMIRIPNPHNYGGMKLQRLVDSVLDHKLFNKNHQLSLF